MKLVLKYGGTSISNAKDIQVVAKHVNELSKKHQIVLVCSATNGTTDDLIEISESIKKENKSKAEQLASKITNRHKQLAKQTIKKSNVQKKLLTKLNEDFTELLALIDGLVLLGEVTSRSMDYLISFGERLSIKLISSALNDLGKKSIPLTGKEVGIVTEYVRKKNPLKRTADGMFSYLLFNNDPNSRYFDMKDYEIFGNDSLIGELFNSNGYICCIGNVFHNAPTEVHFLERLLNVPYRFDKIMSGEFIDKQGNFAKQNLLFYCRNLDYKMFSDMTRLETVLRKNNYIEYNKRFKYI